MPTKPGIYLRGGDKASFELEGNEIEEREIVYATDTGEIGTYKGWFNPYNIGSGTIGVIDFQYDSATRTFGTGWADGKIWNSVSFSGGSRIRLDWRVPMRNDTGGWGGGYVDIQYSYDEGASWHSIGNSGYDGPMASGGDIITSMSGSFTFISCPQDDFTMKLKFRHRSYDGTLHINDQRDIGTGDFGAFWTNITLTEIRK
jgi:hypothetical protein